MMAELHARGTAASKGLKFADYLGDQAKRESILAAEELKVKQNEHKK